jgi:hypothetical protein
VTRLSSHGPRARTEFKRLVLESQIGLRESELAARRSRRQRLRARRVERRLATLRSLLGDLEGRGRPAERSWLRSRAVGYVVSAVWLAGAASLGVEIARHGLDTAAATVGVVVMLAVSLLWFALAVARTPLRDDAQPDETPHPVQRA